MIIYMLLHDVTAYTKLASSPGRAKNGYQANTKLNFGLLSHVETISQIVNTKHY